MSAIAPRRGEEFPPITRAGLMVRIARALAGFDEEAIAPHVNGNRRSARDWKEGRTLPSALYLSRLRAWLPGLAEDLRRLEAADAYAARAHADQYGMPARLADGD